VTSANGFTILPKWPRAQGHPRLRVMFLPTYASETNQCRQIGKKSCKMPLSRTICLLKPCNSKQQETEENALVTEVRALREKLSRSEAELDNAKFIATSALVKVEELSVTFPSWGIPKLLPLRRMITLSMKNGPLPVQPMTRHPLVPRQCRLPC
jgi:hypothetical protein